MAKANYRPGQNWRAADANFVVDSVEQLLGFYDPILTGGADIRFGVAETDITPDTDAGQVVVWDASTSPPTGTAVTLNNVAFDWLSNQKISAGKEVAFVEVQGIQRILWAECEDPPPAEVGLMVAVNEQQQLTNGTWEPVGGLASSYESGSSYFAMPADSKFTILEPGQYQIDFNFSLTGSQANDSLLVRSFDADLISSPVRFDIVQAGASISGAFSYFATFNDNDVTAVSYFGVEVSTDSGTLGTWDGSQLSIKKISSNQTYKPAYSQYFRPGGIDEYHRPGATDTYLRP